MKTQELIYDWIRKYEFDETFELEEVDFIKMKINKYTFEIQWRVNNIILWEIEYDIIWNWSELIYLNTVNQHKEDVFWKERLHIVNWLWWKLIDIYVDELIENNIKEFTLHSLEQAFWFYEKKFSELQRKWKIKRFFKVNQDFFVELF